MTLPLEGLRVIDLTQVMLGPSCTQTLGDFGADIVKVERPGAGDLSRVGVFAAAGNENPVFSALNRNKRSIVIDLSSAEGRVVIRDLIRDADVIVSNFRPGVMERLELGYDDLSAINPRIIWAAGSGFGRSGPYAHKGGQDILGQAYSGVMKRRADPGHPIAIYATPIADYTAGQHLVQGILLAVLQRERTGVGQVVDVSLLNSMLALQMQEATARLTIDEELNWALMPLTGCFPTLDAEIVVIGAFKPNPLADICAALGLPDLSLDERFSTLASLRENRTEIREILARRFAQQTTQHWLTALETEDVLCGPVLDLAQALQNVQTIHNGMILEFVDNDGRSVRTIAPPITLSAVAPSVRHAPPRLGEHTTEVLHELGYTSSAIAGLRARNVVN
ncbi:CoA transferase [Diaminobutyricibacter tongyongensis]|uniref:CoA transferase n=1 Tax=Leifsonia tongyongensis TaxID=1268043 RepID=A0A6L9Y2B0_9MICO|nr:CaiB/BaiF CoA-transferase family protein [Diaminobutyricibacter tongyongensis]NEN07819.1 CoA transferase [Diaminobutyricibacter tongyongensis]